MGLQNPYDQVSIVAMCNMFVKFVEVLYCDIPLGYHFQDSSTGVALSLVDLHDRIMFMLVIVIFFTVYLVYRSFSSSYYVPRLYFNDVLEFGWILIPIVMLYSIAIYSIDLMYSIDEIYDPELTLGITGYQWYWGYNYPDFGAELESRIVPVSDVAKLILKFPEIPEAFIPLKLRNLEVDEYPILPVDTNVRLLVTSADVLHSWTIPSWGIKLDAVPGRINSGGVNIHREGVFYGQCSELCGVSHGFMPIKVACVSPSKFISDIR